MDASVREIFIKNIKKLIIINLTFHIEDKTWPHAEGEDFEEADLCVSSFLPSHPSLSWPAASIRSPVKRLFQPK